MSGVTRRTALGAMGGLALGACDRVSSLLHAGRSELADDPPTTEASIPSYFVSPSVPSPPEAWKLVLSGRVDGTKNKPLSLDDLRAMPKTTLKIRLHAARGWTAVAEWTGVAIRELASYCGAADVPFVELRSFDAPDDVARGYWSSWDRASALHPHTIVAYDINGHALTAEQGAPCRVISPLKLGYKNVKYLTEVNFLDRRTGGYWESRGREWFAGV